MFFVANAEAQTISLEKESEFVDDVGHSLFEEIEIDTFDFPCFLADVNNSSKVIIANTENDKINIVYSSPQFKDNTFFIYGDSNGDGDESLFAYEIFTQTLYKLSFPSLQIEDSTVLNLDNGYWFRDVVLADLYNDGNKKIYFLSRDTTSYTLDPNTFEVIDTLNEKIRGNKLYISDIDGDNENEIILFKYDPTGIYIYDLNLSIKYEHIGPLYDFKFRDIDNNGSIEIYILKSGILEILDFTKSNFIDTIHLENTFFEKINFLKKDNNEFSSILIYGGNEFAAISLKDSTEIKYFSDYQNLINNKAKVLGINVFNSKDTKGLLMSSDELLVFNMETWNVEKELPTFNNLTLSSEGRFHNKLRNDLFISDALPRFPLNENAYVYNFNNDSFIAKISDDQLNIPYGVFADGRGLPIRFAGMKRDDIFYDDFFNNGIRFYDAFENHVVIYPDFNLKNAIPFDITMDSYPEIMGYNEEDNQFEIYSFTNRYSYEKIFQIESEPIYFNYGQFDSDLQKEVFILGDEGDKIKIIDPVTNTVNELKAIDEYPFRSSIIKAIFSKIKGKKVIIILFRDNMYVYDINAQKIIRNFNLIYSNIESFRVVKNGKNKQYFVLFGNNLRIYDEEFNIVLEYEDITHNRLNFNRTLLLNDSDNDKNINMIFVQNNKIIDVEVSGIGDYYQAFQISDQFPRNNQVVNKSCTFFIEFNDPVELDSLLKYFSVVEKSTNKLVDFEIKTRDNLFFEIIPDHMLKSNTDYTLLIDSHLSSAFHKKLDLNNDGYIGIEDLRNVKIDFKTEMTDENKKPSLKIISETKDSIYNDVKVLYKLEIKSNENDNAPIKTLKSGFENEVFIEHLPIDSLFNQCIEYCDLLINTFGKERGFYNYWVIAETFSGMKDTLIIPLKIIDVRGVPFNVNGVGVYMQNYQKRDHINNIFQHKWDLDLDIDDRKAVGENDYFYILVNKENKRYQKDLYKIEIESKQIDWIVEFEENSDYYTDLNIQNGYIYLGIKRNYMSYVYCYNSQDGKLEWETELSEVDFGNYSDGLKVFGDNIILNKSDGIFCLNRWTGNLLWHNENIKNYYKSNLVVFNNTIMLVDNSVLKSINIKNGEIIKKEYNPLFNSASYNGKLMVDSYNNQLIYLNGNYIFAYDINSFSLNWIFEYSCHKQSAIRGNLLYFSEYGKLLALKLNNGQLIETNINSDKYINDIFIFGNLFAIPFYDGMHLFDANTFSYRGKLNGGGNYSMINDVLFFSTYNKIIAYDMLEACYLHEYYSRQVCNGDSVQIGEFTYHETGKYQDTLISFDSCHSIFNLDLNVSNITLSDSIIVHDIGNSRASITLDFSGGISPYRFNWSNGDTTQNLKNLSFGAYNLTVTDSIGCKSEFSFLIKKIDCYEKKVYVNQICFGDSVQIGPYKYYETGIYQDTLFNNDTCQIVFELHLEVSRTELLDSLIIDDQGDESGSISVDFTGGIAPYKFVWSNGDTTQNISDLAYGQYQLTVTDAIGCKSKFSFVLKNINAINTILNNLLIYPTIVKQGGNIYLKDFEVNNIDQVFGIDVNGRDIQLTIRHNYIIVPPDMPTGTYVLKLLKANNKLINFGKFIVIK